MRHAARDKHVRLLQCVQVVARCPHYVPIQGEAFLYYTKQADNGLPILNHRWELLISFLTAFRGYVSDEELGLCEVVSSTYPYEDLTLFHEECFFSQHLPKYHREAAKILAHVCARGPFGTDG
jgi:hypothetical protein